MLRLMEQPLKWVLNLARLVDPNMHGLLGPLAVRLFSLALTNGGMLSSSGPSVVLRHRAKSLLLVIGIRVPFLVLTNGI